MSDEPPIPPTSLSAELVDALNQSTPKQLHDIATYAEELLNAKNGRHIAKRSQTETKRTISQTVSLQKRRSQSRKLTTIATTTGSGEMETKSGPNINHQSALTSRAGQNRTHGCPGCQV